jgi:hypothetical protein
LVADSVGLALLVVLDTLAPAEGLVFVLHDMFAVPFYEIAPMLDQSPTTVRQLASRARRRVQDAAAVPGCGSRSATTSRRRLRGRRVALAWLLQRSPLMLPIPGTSSLTHLEENVAAAGLRLSEEEFRRTTAFR